MNDTTRVLVVDDSTENRLLLKVFLNRHAVSVDEAADGAQAVERLGSVRYDLVLMDVHMPVMDGLSATRAIREQERVHARRATPILALTADDTEADRRRSLDAGCNDHLCKPVSRQSLARALARWLPG